MALQSVQALLALGESPCNTRNFCMVAHVDHGKTTLSDYLVASNGLLSAPLAGEVRLLDSRPDEQERRITMKASSIALHHTYKGTRHLLNLVDSPGHIDFSCEVSTAMRLCDGAVVLVDVVDGVTQQTNAMLRHAYREGLSMCLVLNKIDLLITTQQCTPSEAYVRMRAIVETCNATLAAYVNQLKIQEVDVLPPQQADGSEDDEHGEDDKSNDRSSSAAADNATDNAGDEDEVWFDPCKGNVLFCSCHDGWAFTTHTFASLYAGKLPLHKDTNTSNNNNNSNNNNGSATAGDDGDTTEWLRASLWGECYYDAKNKTIRNTPCKAMQVPLAVQLMLEPVWRLYHTFVMDVVERSHNGSSGGGGDDVDGDNAAECVALARKLGVAERVWNHPRRDRRGKLKALMSAWLPLARCVLDAVCGQLDSPVVAQARRIPALLASPPTTATTTTATNGNNGNNDNSGGSGSGEEALSSSSSIMQALLCCDARATAPCVVYVCKLIDTQYLVGQMARDVGADEATRRGGGDAANGDDDEDMDDVFVGFARVYSGRVRAGQAVYVHSGGAVAQATVTRVYVFRGNGLEAVPEVCAGFVCGLAGLTRHITKYATVSSVPDVPLFRPLVLPSTSIVRLSVIPRDPACLWRLERGLRLLYKVDPQVDTAILPTGEHVIGTAGEVHAERCLRDLADTFARTALVASEPLVTFRETIVGAAAAKARWHVATAADGAVRVTLCARPLPPPVLELLREEARNHGNDADVLRHVLALLRMHKRFARMLRAHAPHGGDDGNNKNNNSHGDTTRHRDEGAHDADDGVAAVAAADDNGLVAYGPMRFDFVGALLLCDFDDDEPPPRNNNNNNIGGSHNSSAVATAHGDKATATTSAAALAAQTLHMWRESIAAGFQAAIESGPMAQEPVYGVAFVLRDVYVAAHARVSSGVVLSCVREACRAAMELHPRRLVEPVYECTVYSSGATQGRIYASLSRRRAEIVEEVPNEGSDLFYVRCWLPAVEAFGLQDELRVQTQGASTAQLCMSHWAVIDADPYFVPTTREEIEEHGSEVATKNIAAHLLERVQRRKGLYRERVVESAEKQKFSLKAA